MERDKRIYVVIIAIGVLAILFSTCFGAFAGGVIGYWVGRKASAAEGYLRQFREWEPEPTVPAVPSPFPLEPYPSVPEIGRALITKVVDGSPAEQAGIQPGDFIIAVDGVRIEGENTLEKIIRKHRPGDKVEIALWSKGHERTVKVKLGAHPEEEDIAYLGVYYVLPMRVECPRND